MAEDRTVDGATRSYGQYCPTTRAVEVLGERWSLLIVRDMLCGTTRFNDLARCNPGLSRTLLSKRLRQLQRAGIVDRDGDHYVLTQAGEELRPVVNALADWGARWQFDEPRDDELDPDTLIWRMHRRLDFSSLPDRRIVLEFRFRGRPERFWIVRDSQGPSVCTHDPGFGVDAVIESELSTMLQVWLGRMTLRAAMHDGRIEVYGTTALVRRLPAMLELSPIAPVVAAASR